MSAGRIFRIRRLVLIALAIVIPATGLALWRARNTYQGPPATDPLVDFQRKLDNGDVKLAYNKEHGYLESLLKNLDIPVSSQALVFSRSSRQLDFVSPQTPRALYFNDDVYVGYVQNGGSLELISVDSRLGPEFYLLSQVDDPKPKLERSDDCLVCHDTFQSQKPVPRLLVLSVLPDPKGTALRAKAIATEDDSPFRERWGGWYVTGTHGAMRHLGNTIVRTPADAIGEIKAYIAQMDLSSGANVTDLASRVNTKPYPIPHSDIAALMVLTHQTYVHNMITSGNYEIQETAPDKAAEVIKEDAELIVKAMLFAGAVPLTDPVMGTSTFAAEFSRRGPRDSRGRSLRELDLKTRLLRYPLSYLVYSRSFDDMRPELKEVVYRRFREVLTGEDQSPAFAHLSAADREAVLAILQETKPDFAASAKPR